MISAVSRSELGQKLFRHTGLVAVAIIFGYPLFWMVMSSLKTRQDFFGHIFGVPTTFRWSNYRDAWNEGNLGHYLYNSSITTLLTLVLVIATAYPLALAIRLRPPGARAVLALFGITLFIPVQLLLIPLYKLDARLGFIDTHWALVFPYSAAALPFAVVFLYAYLLTIPRELDEAATLDGCNRLQLLVRVLIPLSRPAFATVVIFTFFGVWNEFLLALTLTQSSARTLPVGLLNFSPLYTPVPYTLEFAALTVSALPMFAVFLVLQRHFIRGLTAGAVKV